MDDIRVSIGELARRCGLAVRTIRFYCDEGILESHRSAGGHRLFDADSATERLLLIRRLRTLGLGLESITAVLHGDRSLEEAIVAETASVDAEFASLAWRRASLRAVTAAPASQRTARLILLTAAQDGAAAHDHLVRFWRRILTPIPRHDIDRYVSWNVPEPPIDPSVDAIVAYAELASLAADPSMQSTLKRHVWRTRPELVRDPRTLYDEIGEIMDDVVIHITQDVTPHHGRELDHFVTAHANARNLPDSPEFRTHLLADATDPRIHRYWSLTEQLLGPRITVGRALHWIHDALRAGGHCPPA